MMDSDTDEDGGLHGGAFLDTGEPNLFWGAVDMEWLRQELCGPGVAAAALGGGAAEDSNDSCVGLRERFIGLPPARSSLASDSAPGDNLGEMLGCCCCPWAFRWGTRPGNG